LGLPVPAFDEVSTPADVIEFGNRHGWPCVVKAVRGGYDGRGVWVMRTPEEVERTIPELVAGETPLMVEQHVPLRRELAAVVAGSPFGQGAVWPVVETVQSEGICVRVEAPAADLDESLTQQAHDLALTIAEQLGVVGVLAV